MTASTRTCQRPDDSQTRCICEFCLDSVWVFNQLHQVAGRTWYQGLFQVRHWQENDIPLIVGLDTTRGDL